jgi:hypothetical protein
MKLTKRAFITIAVLLATSVSITYPNSNQICDAANVDMRKSAIEVPLKNEISRLTSQNEALPAPPVLSANPKVQPGLIVWRKTFDEACKASALSGKPVLLFQMMGKLDDRFC